MYKYIYMYKYILQGRRQPTYDKSIGLTKKDLMGIHVVNNHLTATAQHKYI